MARDLETNPTAGVQGGVQGAAEVSLLPIVFATSGESNRMADTGTNEHECEDG